MYVPGNKKTSSINAFKRTKVIRPRDIYARYGERNSNSGILSTGVDTIGDPIPTGSAVIASMIAGQNALLNTVPLNDDQSV